MAIIRNTMEDIKRYIGSNGQTDDARKDRQMMRERKKRYEHCRSLCVRRLLKIGLR